MRRRLIAVLMTLAMLVLGCTPGGEAPSPTPTAETALPEDVVSADDAATAVVAALNAQDLSAIPMVRSASAAQEDFETIFAGMDEIYPEVTLGDISYADTDGWLAEADLTFDYTLGEDGWTYPSTATFRLSGGQWRLDWAPSVIHPDLTEYTRLRHTINEAKRAPINDNEGIAIVEERSLYEVGIDKANVDQAEWAQAAADLATALEIDVAAYTAKVTGGGPQAYVVAATMRQEEIPAEVTNVPGLLVREVTAVVGPASGFAPHLIGTVGNPTAEMIEKSEGKLTAVDRVGLSGLQARYDDQLRGVPSLQIDIVARQGATAGGTSASPTPVPTAPVPVFKQDESVSTGINLSLDRDLQTKAEEILSTQEGLASLVVIDVKTGGVLVAAQSPSGGTYPHATFGQYAPGSTFKAVSSLAMLRAGLTPTSTVQCPANLTVGTFTFGNYSGYPSSAIGAIPLTTAFAQSCNTSFVGAAGTITGEALHGAAGSLGVGTDYDAGFPANFGTVQPANSIDLAASMIGQGQITMSPLGMAAVAASIKAGKTVIPWLVEGEQAVSTAAPLTANEATQLQTMMKATVDSGTAKQLQGLMTGAKTGTAQWGDTNALQTSAWMIAYNDNYAVASFVEVGDSGGTTAAPLITQLFS